MDELIKLIPQFGTTGLGLYLAYRLIDKYAGQFLTASKEHTLAVQAQANSIGTLASTVQAGQGDQKEILMAVRVMAGQIEELKELVRGKK